MTWFRFEEALQLLVKYMSGIDQKKPTLFHSIRVGSFLWNHNYSEDIQIAGLLHDSLEDTEITETEIQENFWVHVLGIVKANSKDMSLPKEQRLEDIVRRCSEHSEDALIVKIADVYDNFLFYTRQGNTWEIERCQRLARCIQKHKKKEYRDNIFNMWEEILCYKK